VEKQQQQQQRRSGEDQHQHQSGNAAKNVHLKSEITESSRLLLQPTVLTPLQPQSKPDLGVMYDLSGLGDGAGAGASSTNLYASGNSMASKELKKSVFVPRILPGAFQNISSRFFPSDYENESAGWSRGRKPQHQKQHGQHRYLSSGVQTQQIIRSERDGMPSRSLPSSPLKRIMSKESLTCNLSAHGDQSHGQRRKLFQNVEFEDSSKDDDISMSNSESDDGSGISHDNIAVDNANDATPMIANRRNISGISENTDVYNDPSNYKYGAATSKDANSSISIEDDVNYGGTEISPLLSQTASMGGHNMDKELGERRLQRDNPTPRFTSMSMSAVSTRTLTKRSIRHKIYLILTDLESSMFSAAICSFFVFLIAMSNVVIFMKTMNKFQYTPDECTFCDDFSFSESQALSSSYESEESFACKCPPEAIDWVNNVDQCIMALLTVEWVLRALCYDPPRNIDSSPPLPFSNCCRHLAKPYTILDALATFPYYLELYEDTIFDFLDGSGISYGHITCLRFLRSLRVFQMVRLGSQTSTFSAIVNVLAMAVSRFVYLLGFIAFGGMICASLAFWFERGEWRYTDLLDPPGWAWVRPSPNGLTEEISPFTSIIDALYWFMVTSTTVGYGDVYPTSPGGKIVAGFTMTLGVLCYALPVSIFSELWQRELKQLNAYTSVTSASASTEGHSVYNSNESRSDTTPPKIISTLTPVVENNNKRNSDSSQPSIGTNEENKRSESESIRVPRDDLLAIRCYMETIEDAQTKLKEILNKMEQS